MMRVRQQGMTLISIIVVVAFVGAFAFAGLKVMPMYLEQMKVANILEDVKKDMDGKGPSVAQIRSAIAKRLDIEMVTGIQTQEFKIKKVSKGYSVQAQYERRELYFGNLYLVAVFDEQVEIKQ